MEENAQSRRFLAAIDLDGTLFGPTGVVSPASRAALDALVERGFTVAIASGRHPADVAQIATGLPMVEWFVAGQGCEVADAGRRRVLARNFLPAGVGARVAEAGRQAGFGVIAYTVDGEVAAWDGTEIRRYEAVSHTRVQILDPGVFAREPLFKIMWIGPEARIGDLVAAGGAPLPGLQAETVRSHDYVFEFVPAGVSKGTGVAALARELGLSREAVVGFGDADNDIPLFDWAGCSVAMPQARPHVRARAALVAPTGGAEDAFARGVAHLFETRPNLFSS